VRAERELRKLEHETEQSVRIEPCLSPVWDTAIVSVCLQESGVPEITGVEAIHRVADDQEIRFRGDWQYKNAAKVEPSGWVFEFENQWNPDVDDTAMVLLALRKAPTDNAKSATSASSAA